MSKKVSMTEKEWKQLLTAEQFAVTRKKGTEPAFSGQCEAPAKPGTYHCVCCDAPLFHSIHKFDSGSGWPSYWQPVDDDRIVTMEDLDYGMRRVEVLCARCDAHLGHVFEDGPPPTGLRYCINSISLKFRNKS